MCSWSWLPIFERSGWNSKLWVWREFLSILYWNHMSVFSKTRHGPLNWHLMWSSVSVILNAQRKEAAGNACPKATVDLFPFWVLEKLWKSWHCSFFHLKNFRFMCHLYEVNHPERMAGRIGIQSLNPDGAE